MKRRAHKEGLEEGHQIGEIDGAIRVYSNIDLTYEEILKKILAWSDLDASFVEKRMAFQGIHQ